MRDIRREQESLLFTQGLVWYLWPAAGHAGELMRDVSGGGAASLRAVHQERSGAATWKKVSSPASAPGALSGRSDAAARVVEPFGERGVWPGPTSVILVVERGREPFAVPCDCEQRDAVWGERDRGVADCHSDGAA
jgi:hypothetical protein